MTMLSDSQDTAYAELRLAQACERMLYTMMHVVNPGGGLRGEAAVVQAFEVIRMALHRRVSDIFESVMLLHLNERNSKRAEAVRRRAYDRFLASGKSVAYLFSPDLKSHGMYACEDETTFRLEIARAFGIQEDVEKYEKELLALKAGVQKAKPKRPARKRPAKRKA